MLTCVIAMAGQLHCSTVYCKLYKLHNKQPVTHRTCGGLRLIHTYHAMPMPRPCHAVSLPYDLHRAHVFNSHMPCRAHAMLRPCRFKSDLSRPPQSTARHCMCELTSAVSRGPVGPRFGCFRLPCGHSRRLLTRMLLPFVTCLICSDGGDNRLYRIIHLYELTLKLKPAFRLLLRCVSIMRSSFVCGQQLFQVLKFLNTHSKIFEKLLPLISQTSKLNVKFAFPFARTRHIMNPVLSFGGAAKGRRGCRIADTPNPQN
jgi:hypothetical protein